MPHELYPTPEDKESSKSWEMMQYRQMMSLSSLLLAFSHMGAPAGCFPSTPQANTVLPPAAPQQGLGMRSSLQLSKSCAQRGGHPHSTLPHLCFHSPEISASQRRPRHGCFSQQEDSTRKVPQQLFHSPEWLWSHLSQHQTADATAHS